jgi:1,4-dihydroxy-2-naphthoyl-CoA hydrolase
MSEGGIWFRRPSPESIKARHVGTLPALMGMEFDEVGDDFIRGRLPVDERSIQPAGILHGGASVVLAETLGSTACAHTLDPSTHYCVGLEINANHVRSAPKGSGWVSGTARRLHAGRSTQVWEIRITDGRERLVCISRLTLAILPKKPA